MENLPVIADGELKPLIKECLKGAFAGEPLKKGSWIRVSSLSTLCPREEVLRSKDNVVRDDPYDGDLGLIFEHGHALHWVLQNKVMPATGTFYGKWRCTNLECGFEVGGWDPNARPRKSILDSQVARPKVCASCGQKLDSDNSIYVEQHFKNFEYRIQGHPDGFLRIPGMEGTGVFEAKSINPKGAWEVRGCPKLDHVVQVQCYMWLTGCRWAKILYWDKGGMGLSALVEHTIEYDEALTDTIKEEIAAIWVGIEDGILPERTCEIRSCARAKKCAVADVCFERD